MSEIAEFLHHGAEQITPKILEGIHKKLPALKLEFAEIDAPKYPHLAEQLEFLAGVVEDCVEGADDTLPLVPHIGHADESSIVRAILIENERVLSEYAERRDIDWVTVKP